MDLISVIVPLYNTEQYIDECIESLIKQSYTNIEIIIINDGSVDNSLKICEDYAKSDNRIKIINLEENKGLSEARNVGITHAQGEYIAFVDSDDFVTEEYLKILYDAMKGYDADLVQCDFYEGKYKDESASTDTDLDQNIQVFSGREMIKNIYNHMCLQTTLVWTKLYKREVLFKEVDYCKSQNSEGYIRFPKGMIHEDEAFCYKIYDQVDKVVCVSNKLYCHRYVEDSITNRSYSYKRLDELKHLEERIRIFNEKKDVGLVNLTLRRYYYELIMALNNCRKYIPSSIETQKEIKIKINIILRKLMLVNKFEDKSLLKTKLIIIKCMLLRLFKTKVGNK